MLANLLPGVRALRAPLSAGYVWLVALYIAFEPSFPTRTEASGVWESLLTLKDELSAVGVTVAASFLAYIVGSISEALFGAFGEIRGRFDHPHFRARSETLPLAVTARANRTVISVKGQEALNDVIGGRVESFAKALHTQRLPVADVIEQIYLLGRQTPTLPGALATLDPVRNILHAAGDAFSHDASQWTEDHEHEALDQLHTVLNDNVLAELDLTLTRLLGKENELFSAIDRLRSEAEFRFALAPALVGLACALGWRAGWWLGVVAIASALVLALQGRNRKRRSNDALLEALRINRASAPSIERFDEVNEQLAEREISDDEIQDAALHAYREAYITRHVEGTFKLGALLEQRDDLAGALDAYGRAAGKDHPAATFRIGVLLEERGNEDAALEMYRKARGLGYVPGVFALGQVLERRGDDDGALDAYRRAAGAEDAPGWTPTEATEARIRLGMLLERKGDLAGAVEQLNRAVDESKELGDPTAGERARDALDRLGRGGADEQT